MKESHRKGIANHSGPESCRGGGNSAREALTGENTGREIELRNQESGVPTMLRQAEGNTQGDGQGKTPRDPAESKALRMCGHSLHGNRETPGAPSADGVVGRSEKATNLKSDMHANGESHGPIVPKKPPNKGKPTAEVVEGRGPTKQNSQQVASPGTQRPISESPELLSRRKATPNNGVVFSSSMQGKNRMR